jgi:hypothetical protein
MGLIAAMHHYVSSKYRSTHIKAIQSANIAAGIANGGTQSA